MGVNKKNLLIIFTPKDFLEMKNNFFIICDQSQLELENLTEVRSSWEFDSSKITRFDDSFLMYESKLDNKLSRIQQSMPPLLKQSYIT